MLAAGVCHSDLHLADGWFDLGGGKRMSLADRGMKLPVTLGHENVGEVVAVGPRRKGVKIGDKLLADPWIGCGDCGLCKRGEENLCRAMRSLGVFSNGGYADYLIVPHPRYLFDIGDLPPERAAPLACSGVTTFGALEEGADAEERTDGDHRRRRSRADVPRACTRRWAATRPSSSISIRPSATRRRKPARPLSSTAGRRTPSQQIRKLTNGGAWAVIDLVGSSASGAAWL